VDISLKRREVSTQLFKRHKISSVQAEAGPAFNHRMMVFGGWGDSLKSGRKIPPCPGEPFLAGQSPAF
jgi:hypothetical protein